MSPKLAVGLWFALAALMVGGFIYTREGLATLALCAIAWVGGVVSVRVYNVIKDTW